MSNYDARKTEEFNEAVAGGKLEIVKQLVGDPEVDVNDILKTEGGFMRAIFRGRANVIKYLLDLTTRKINFEMFFTEDRGFYQCVAFKHPEALKLILQDDRFDIIYPIEPKIAFLTFALTCDKIAAYDTMELLVLSGKMPNLHVHQTFRNETIRKLIRDAEADPGGTADRLERKWGFFRSMKSAREKEMADFAGQMFALSVFVSDNYLSIPDRL